MNVYRLKKLIEILERVPNNQFNMSVWCKRDYNADRSIKQALKHGFVGCVGGWAAQSRAFQKQGFTMVRANRFTYIEYKNSAGLTYTDINAFMHFFGLTKDQTKELVYATRYNVQTVTPYSAINKIKGMLRLEGISI